MIMRRLGGWGAVLLAATLLVAGSAVADGGRRALVIGNGAYAEGALANPVNDATDFAAKLRGLGFQADLLLDADQRAMDQAIHTFTRALTGEGTVGLFYFAGHGVEYEGRNYLIPIGAAIRGAVDLRYEAVDAGRVLDGMAESGNGLNLVVLDACRNNPFPNAFRSASRGLARLTPAKGTLILYATQPGAVASDGGGRNGVFTKHLLAAMGEPGLEVEQAFKHAALAVDHETAGAQTPWVEGVVLGQFAFAPAAAAPAPAAAVPVVAPPAPVAAAPDQSQFELAFWNSVKNSDDPADFQAYLTKYPQGQFKELARRRIERLTAAARSVPTIRPQLPSPPSPASPRPPSPPAFAANAHVCRLDPNGDNFLSLRSGPRSSASEFFRLSGNTALAVLETRGPWLRVRLRDGTLGWAFGQWVCRHGN
ncbi:caspase family protein [uncultured Thiodictyon sp.]|uniref:caspase family protein n=1 Tax=uncultured Thiodictyon sp. TaxID=1846217 RepID=UPI0025F7FC17|nr:caspase family protein [uncultured Thiodictyon sp.]